MTRLSLLTCVALAGAAACGSRDRLSDSAQGDVAQDSAIAGVTFRGVKYPLTSDNYKKFATAQAALDALPARENFPRIDVRNPTDQQIDLTVQNLESDAAAKRAIENSGMSVRDFVLTSLALGQALSFKGSPDIPAANFTFVDSNRADIDRVDADRRFFIVEDDRARAHDEDEDRARGEGHDNGKHRGRGHEKGHGKHGKH